MQHQKIKTYHIWWVENKKTTKLSACLGASFEQLGKGNVMNTDYKSLEQRYGSLLAAKIHEEIARVEQRRFSFYQLPDYLQSLCDEIERDEAVGLRASSQKDFSRVA